MSDTVEGRNAVAEALASGIGVRRVVFAQGLPRDPALDRIRAMAAERGVRIDERPRKDLDSLSERGAHQGVIAEVKPFRYAELSEVLKAAEGADRSLIVALDHVTDPGNLGAVARSAEVAGAHGVIIESRRSASVGPAAFKASAGAVAHVPIVRATNLVRALEELKKAGYWVAGASERADTLAWDAPLEGRLVLVMGAEGEGLSRLVGEACDFLVSLPVAGKVGSLNVAQAATVLAYEWVRRGAGG